ncbi:TonB C-terminal domain-containing protein [Alcaligenaceae bacterium]|nr:TonB C-terminal domain-containing protein [Alcaligenaceae bacterium]
MATGQIARAECVECHRRVPKTEAQQKTVEVKTGRSGASFSFGIFSQKSRPRVNSGRNYYRKKVQWICNDCSGVTAELRRQEEAKLKRQKAREAWLALTPIQRAKARSKSFIKWVCIVSAVLIAIAQCSKPENEAPASTTATSRVSPAPRNAPATKSAENSYAAQVRDHIRSHIAFIAPPQEHINPSVLYRADLTRTGDIQRVQILEPSGNAEFDVAVQRGIAASSPLPKSPTGAYPAYIEGQYRMYD